MKSYLKIKEEHICDPSYLIDRYVKVDLADKTFKETNICVIYGRAGLGKSSFAKLLALRQNASIINHQASTQDANFLNLCLHIYNELKFSIENYHSEAFENLLKISNIDDINQDEIVDAIIKPLLINNCRIVIIFDDTHLIPTGSTGRKCMEAFLERSSADLKFILCTNFQIYINNSLSICEDTLLVDQEELKEFIKQSPQYHSSLSGINTLLDNTGGAISETLSILRPIASHNSSFRKVIALNDTLKEVNSRYPLCLLGNFKNIDSGLEDDTYLNLKNKSSDRCDFISGIVNIFSVMINDYGVDVDDEIFAVAEKEPLGNQISALFGIWQIDKFLMTGAVEKAAAILDKYENTKNLPHSLSLQFLSYKALVDSGLGNNKEAKDIVTLISREKPEEGVFYKKVEAIVLTSIGMYDRAEEIFFRLISENSSDIINLTSKIFLSYIHSQRGKDKEATEFAFDAAKQMYAKGIRSVSCVPWSVYIYFLKKASENKELEDFVTDILFDRFNLSFDDKRNLINILHIKSFGSFEFCIGDRSMNFLEMAHIGRIIFSTLLCKANLRASVEEIMGTLWPESSEKSARINFDTAVTRLRNSLGKHLGVEGKNYLKVKNGIIFLANVKVDAIEFEKFALRSIKDYDRGNFVSSVSNFIHAENFFDGQFLESIRGIDNLYNMQFYYEKIFLRLIRVGMKHKKNLNEFFDVETLIDSHVYKNLHYYEFVKEIAEYYKEEGRKAEIIRLKKVYRMYLEDNETEPEEIEEIIADTFKN